MDTPTILTESQRSEVREMLQRLSGSINQSTPVHKSTKRVKRLVNPFDDILPGQHVNGLDLSPDCVCLPFVQRSRICILPFFYDSIAQSRQEWIDMIYNYTGATLTDSTDLHLRFCVNGNPPIRFLHIYLKQGGYLENFLYAA